VTTDGQRAARAAFDAARASFDRLTGGGDPRSAGRDFVEAWSQTEQALRALAGTSTLSGVAVVRELRQRSLLTLDDAHALVDLHAAAERARSDDYTPTTADIEVARAANARLTKLLVPAGTAGEGEWRASKYGGLGGRSTPLPPGPPAVPPDDERDSRPAPAPAPVRTNRLAAIVVGLAVLAVLGAGAFYVLRFRGEPSSLGRARAAFAAGDRLTARNAFAMAASESPSLAEPHIYLGRLAREAGDRATASAELRLAVQLEPGNYLAHRELAAYLLWSGQAELARSFYQRAIELNPQDRVALGYMGCTLLRLGRGDLAVRFFERAGVGDWLACQGPAVAAPTPPGAAAPR